MARQGISIPSDGFADDLMAKSITPILIHFPFISNRIDPKNAIPFFGCIFIQNSFKNSHLSRAHARTRARGPHDQTPNMSVLEGVCIIFIHQHQKNTMFPGVLLIF